MGGDFFLVCLKETELQTKIKRRKKKKIRAEDDQNVCTKENQQLDKTQRIQNSRMQTTDQLQRKGYRYFFGSFLWTMRKKNLSYQKE